jgi:hypothetical protein
MENNLRKELKILAEQILNEQKELDFKALLNQTREIYEKCVLLNHLNNEDKTTVEEHANIDQIEAPYVEQTPIIEELEFVVESVNEITELEDLENSENSKMIEEDEVIPSLNDLFVPTFDDIREDMSQKAEFKDTISLDDTENLFVTKKKENKQLSLNDKLVGSNLQIGLNDRIAFVNKLFNFSQSDFNKVLTKLNAFTSKDEALKYFQYQVKPNYNWKGKEDLEERFIGLIERKFM